VGRTDKTPLANRKKETEKNRRRKWFFRIVEKRCEDWKGGNFSPYKQLSKQEKG